jgi:ribulose kinase
MFSDILNMKILTTENNEVGVLGLAICQSSGLGVYNDFKKAITKMVKIKTEYDPDSNKNLIYIQRYKEFERIKNLLDQ